jgi:hypothetical protein
MTHNFFELKRLVARLRAPLLTATIVAFTACDTPELTEPVQSSDPEVVPVALEPTPDVQPVSDGITASLSAYQGGIPIGLFAQPTSAYGSRYSGAMRNIFPSYLKAELAAIKARGGKVMLMMVGHEKYYKDADGHFSFNKWVDRVNRFRNVDFSAYIKDGTIIGHYLIDEPQDPANWGGRPIPGATLEKMAQYSKRLWPSMTTIVRAEPAKIRWGSRYQYLDAAWAQYVYRRGDVNDFVRQNVSNAQNMGLALVVGLNISKGSPTRGKMSPTQARNAGLALLNSTYPCAFISWIWDSGTLSGSMGTVMDELRRKAQNRSSKTCRGS